MIMNKSISTLTIFPYLLLLATIGISQPKQIFISEDIQLLELSDSVYLHATWTEMEPYGRFSSNGLIVIKNGKALMVDTPMDSAATSFIYKHLLNSLNAQVTLLIPGHFHDDCIAGLPFLQTKGARSLSGNLTREKCLELNLPIPDTAFIDSIHFEFNSIPIACYYLGGGHTHDNIVVYLPQQKILFGGCMVKSMESMGMGFIGDADLEAWPNTLQKLKSKFPEAEIIVPGHGNVGGIELIDHTLLLLQQNASKNK